MARQARLTTRLKIGAKRAGLRWRERWSRIDLLCEQDRWWVDKHGVLHDVNKIDADYQSNLLEYFRRNASRFQFLRLFYRPSPYEAQWEDDNADDTDAWIEGQPLVRRLRELTGGTA